MYSAMTSLMREMFAKSDKRPSGHCIRHDASGTATAGAWGDRIALRDPTGSVRGRLFIPRRT